MQFPCIITSRLDKNNRIQPKLSISLSRFYMDMGRFATFVAEKEEAMPADTQYSRHLFSILYDEQAITNRFSLLSIAFNPD